MPESAKRKHCRYVREFAPKMALERFADSCRRCEVSGPRLLIPFQDTAPSRRPATLKCERRRSTAHWPRYTCNLRGSHRMIQGLGSLVRKAPKVTKTATRASHRFRISPRRLRESITVRSQTGEQAHASSSYSSNCTPLYKMS